MNAIDPQHLIFLPAASSSGAGRYIDWGVVHISVTNLLIIVLMVITFVVALLVPFPGTGEEWGPPATPASEEPEARP